VACSAVLSSLLLVRRIGKMAKVTVYNVKVYDISTDEQKISRRMATLEGAAKMQGTVIEHR